jgi:hypothetical protein
MTADTGGPVENRNYQYETHYEDSGVPDSKRINRETAERCLFFLAQSAESHAAWSARRRFLDKYMGIVLAMEETKAGPGSATDRTRKAKKSIAYLRVLRDLEEASYHETLLYGLRSAAEKKFSGWQTLNANLRTGVNL